VRNKKKAHAYCAAIKLILPLSLNRQIFQREEKSKIALCMFVLNELLAVLSPCLSLRQACFGKLSTAQGTAQFSISVFFLLKRSPEFNRELLYFCSFCSCRCSQRPYKLSIVNYQLSIV